MAEDGMHEEAIKCFEEAILADPSSVATYCKKGESYLVLGKHQFARECYGLAVRLDPKHVGARLGTGHSFAALNMHKDAVNAYAEAIKIDPKCIDAYVSMGDSFGVLGDHRESIKRYADAIWMEPDRADVHKAMGDRLAALSDYDLAVKSYQESLRLEPDKAETHVGMGVSLAALGRHIEAVKSCEVALCLDSQNVDAYIRMGNSQAVLGDHKSSLAAYNKAIQLDPQNAMAHFLKGTAKEKLGSHLGAMHSYDEAMRLEPKCAMAHLRKGRVLEVLGKHSRAERFYRQAVLLNPDNARVHMSLGDMYGSLKRPYDAVKSYLEALRLEPDNARVHMSLGDMYGSLKRPYDAVKSYLEALRLEPDNARVHMSLGDMYGSLKRPYDAVKSYLEALRLEPDNARVHMSLGDMYGSLKRPYDAVKSYLEALRLEPDNARVHMSLGDMYGSLKRPYDAVKSYLEALRLEPDNANIHSCLGVSLAQIDDHERAIHHYMKAICLEPANASIYSNLGVSLEALGDHRGAITSYDAVMRIKEKQLYQLQTRQGAITNYDETPDLEQEHMQASSRKGELLATLGDHKSAIACYTKAISINPEHMILYHAKGKVYAALGKHAEAIECYDDVLKLEPDNTSVLMSMSISFEAMGDHKNAITCYANITSIVYHSTVTYREKTRVLATLGEHTEEIKAYETTHANSSDGPAYSECGILHAVLGEHAEAIECYDKSLRLKPDHVHTVILKGCSLAGIGDHHGAILCYDKALSLDPDHAYAFIEKGISHDALREHTKAIGCYNHILQQNPKDAKTNQLKGHSFEALGERQKARACFILADESITVSNKDVTPIGTSSHPISADINTKNLTKETFQTKTDLGRQATDTRLPPNDVPDSIPDRARVSQIGTSSGEVPEADGNNAKDGATKPGDGNGKATEKLKGYQNRLLQIHRSNRCICLGKIYHKHNFDLTRLDMEHQGMSDKVIKGTLGNKATLCMLPDSNNSEHAIRMRQHLQQLSRNIRASEDETGTQYCYIGFPFLEGRVNADYYIRAPIMLFPVSVYHNLSGPQRGWNIKYHEGAPILNRTLFTALKKIGGFQLDEKFEGDLDEAISSTLSNASAEDLVSMLTRMIKAKMQKVEQIPDHSDQQFTNMTRDEINKIPGGPFMIKNHKIVGSFPQGDSAIYKDYQLLIDTGEVGGFIQSILDADQEEDNHEHTSENGQDDSKYVEIDRVPDAKLNMILPSDSSQDQIVLRSQNEEITLVRGPPGTGKSQVIVNIIANALSKKQTVLVVCQKRAALEVVQQRLAEEGLDRCAVLLNREKEDRATMYSQIRNMLSMPRHSGGSVDGDLDNISRKIDQLISSHADITAALADKSVAGTTVRHLYSHSKKTDKQKRLDLDTIARRIQFRNLDDILESMSEIEQNYKKFDMDSHPWFNRNDFSDLGGSDKIDIKELLSKMKSAVENCLMAKDSSVQEELVTSADRRASLVKKQATLRNNIDRLEASVTGFLKKATRGLQNLTDLDHIKRDAKTGAILWNRFGSVADISRVLDHAIVEGSMQAQQKIIGAFSAGSPSIIKRMFDQTARKNAAIKKEFLARQENTGLDTDDIMNRLRDGMALWDLAKDSDGIDEIRNPILLADRNEQDQLITDVEGLRSDKEEIATCEADLTTAAESLHTLLKNNGIESDIEPDPDETVRLAKNGSLIYKHMMHLSRLFKSDEADRLCGIVPDPETLEKRVISLLDGLQDFEDLRKYDSRKAKIDEMIQNLLKQCSLHLDVSEDWTSTVREEIYNVWIEAIEKKHHILREGFDDHATYRKKLAHLINEKCKLVARQIVEGTRLPATEREFSKLDYELSKKRKIMPVRKLIENFEGVLYNLVPCWLASPEMTSNVFPMKKDMFDMIIVDEASQLAAERTMPFLYRGRRKIIAGDENQLKPHDLFQIRESDDNDDDEYKDRDEVMHIKSLLDLVKMRYQAHTLQWHYRSQWQELIDFSNHAFYNGMLHVAPNVDKNPPEPPIDWIDCQGVWENKANQMEADRVVDEIDRLIRDADENGAQIPTIGVIAFNVGQRDKILDMIEIRRSKDPEFDRLYSLAENPRSAKKDDEIFIRNIENIQGDEREIVIFSVGYAKDPAGQIRMQFGSLNQEGGENRINVAVTRASKKIIVICSINPDDMKVDDLKNRGPRLLRDFLTYAHAVSGGDTRRVSEVISGLNPATERRTSGSSIADGQSPDSVIHDSPFEEIVYDSLKRTGYTVDTQVGQSGYRIDLAIVDPLNPAKYILGIECDGATYHSAKSVRENDVFRQKFLERRGWNIERIWSRDWWMNSQGEITKIQKKVDSLMNS